MFYGGLRRWALFLSFGLCVPAANWLIENVGTTCVPDGPCLIPVGFGLMAPSGVLVIGLAFVLRDWLHEMAGGPAALCAVMFGVALTLFVASPALAAASAFAFFASELVDFGVYSAVRVRSRSLAVLASGVAGAFVDSLLFLWIAFGSVDFALGLVLAKAYASIAVAAWFWFRSRGFDWRSGTV